MKSGRAPAAKPQKPMRGKEKTRCPKKRPCVSPSSARARRSDYLYGPIVAALPGRGRIGLRVGAQRRLGAPPGRSTRRALVHRPGSAHRETAPQIGIVSVTYSANGEVGLMAVEHGLHVLLETPIAHKLSEADAIIAAPPTAWLEDRSRRAVPPPPARTDQAGADPAPGSLAASTPPSTTLPVTAITASASCAAILGFDAKPVQVTGAVRQYELGAHWSRLGGKTGPRTETQEHGTDRV